MLEKKRAIGERQWNELMAVVAQLAVEITKCVDPVDKREGKGERERSSRLHAISSSALLIRDTICHLLKLRADGSDERVGGQCGVLRRNLLSHFFVLLFFVARVVDETMRRRSQTDRQTQADIISLSVDIITTADAQSWWANWGLTYTHSRTKFGAGKGERKKQRRRIFSVSPLSVLSFLFLKINALISKCRHLIEFLAPFPPATANQKMGY